MATNVQHPSQNEKFAPDFHEEARSTYTVYSIIVNQRHGMMTWKGTPSSSNDCTTPVLFSVRNGTLMS